MIRALPSLKFETCGTHIRAELRVLNPTLAAKDKNAAKMGQPRLCIAAEKHGGDVAIKEVFRYVLRDHRFVGFEQADVA